MNVVTVDGKTMDLILGPFYVGDVPGYFISDVDFDHLWTVVASDRSGMDCHLVAIAFNTFFACFDIVRKILLGKTHYRLELIRLDHLSVVRFSEWQWHVVKQLLRSALSDIDQLMILRM